MPKHRLMVLMSIAVLLGWAGVSLGAIAVFIIQVEGVPVARAQLLTNAVAITNGEWLDASGMGAMSIHISGITTATVEVDGSNAPTIPANTAHEIKLNTVDITADQMVALTLSMRWLKVRIPAYTSGTINAYLEARYR
jgi:hypothetical protein